MKITIKNTEYCLYWDVLLIIHVRIYKPYGNDTVREFDIEIPYLVFQSFKNQVPPRPTDTSDIPGDPDDIPF